MEVPTSTLKLLQTLDTTKTTEEQKAKEAEEKKNSQPMEPYKTAAQRKVYVWDSESDGDKEVQERPPTPGRNIQWNKEQQQGK